jgi:hypothetical protein
VEGETGRFRPVSYIRLIIVPPGLPLLAYGPVGQ